MAAVTYPTADGSLFHVKCNGATIDISNNQQASYALAADLQQRHGKENVQLYVIRDTRNMAAVSQMTGS